MRRQRGKADTHGCNQHGQPLRDAARGSQKQEERRQHADRQRHRFFRGIDGQHCACRAAEDIARLIGSAAQQDRPRHQQQDQHLACSATEMRTQDRCKILPAGDADPRRCLLKHEGRNGRESNCPEQCHTKAHPGTRGGCDSTRADECGDNCGPQQDRCKAPEHDALNRRIARCRKAQAHLVLASNLLRGDSVAKGRET